MRRSNDTPTTLDLICGTLSLAALLGSYWLLAAVLT
jgi:hypothetical protein